MLFDFGGKGITGTSNTLFSLLYSGSRGIDVFRIKWHQVGTEDTETILYIFPESVPS